MPSANNLPAQALWAGVARRFGRPPVGVWAAPGRINLIGEHTDYNAGLALPLALPLHTSVALARSRAGLSRVYSEPLAGEASFRAGDSPTGGWSDYVAGLFRALRDAGFQVPDCDLLIDSTVPIGAGLASSAALTCAVAVALRDALDLPLGPDELAGLAQRAENGLVGAATGAMDQLASMHGREGHALLLDCRSRHVRPVPLALAEHGLELLVIDTRTRHAHVGGEYAARRRSCVRASAELGVANLREVTDLPDALARLGDPVLRRRVRHVVSENDRVRRTVDLLDAGADLRRIGPVLTASHVSLRDDYEVSAAPVDVAVQAALDAGAHGARITGGGFGGCAIALVDAGRGPAIFGAVERAGLERGFAAPGYFTARAAAGARRLR